MKTIAPLMAASFLTLTIGFSVHAEDDIAVVLNGQQLAFDQPPIIQEDRTLVPMRKIFESFGMMVHWNGDTNTISAFGNGVVLRMSIGDKDIIKLTNSQFIQSLPGEVIENDVAPSIVSGRTLVPVRVIADTLGVEVDWVEESRTVILDGENSSEFDFIETENGNYIYGEASSDGPKIQLDRDGGLIYIGEFDQHMRRDGKGKAYFPDRGIVYYDGDWEQGAMSGNGKLFDQDGALMYEGEFKNDLYDGFGTMFKEDGQVDREGQWKNGEPFDPETQHENDPHDQHSTADSPALKALEEEYKKRLLEVKKIADEDPYSTEWAQKLREEYASRAELQPNEQLDAFDPDDPDAQADVNLARREAEAENIVVRAILEEHQKKVEAATKKVEDWYKKERKLLDDAAN